MPDSRPMQDLSSDEKFFWDTCVNQTIIPVLTATLEFPACSEVRDAAMVIATVADALLKERQARFGPVNAI